MQPPYTYLVLYVQLSPLVCQKLHNILVTKIGGQYQCCGSILIFIHMTIIHGDEEGQDENNNDDDDDNDDDSDDDDNNNDEVI